MRRSRTTAPGLAFGADGGVARRNGFTAFTSVARASCERRRGRNPYVEPQYVLHARARRCERLFASDSSSAGREPGSTPRGRRIFSFHGSHPVALAWSPLHTERGTAAAAGIGCPRPGSPPYRSAVTGGVLWLASASHGRSRRRRCDSRTCVTSASVASTRQRTLRTWTAITPSDRVSENCDRSGGSTPATRRPDGRLPDHVLARASLARRRA
jgi:hypothetical protein